MAAGSRMPSDAVLIIAVPYPLGAQQVKAHRVGILAQDLQPGLLETFRDELHKLGYVKGSGISIEPRNAAGRNERLPALVEELLRHKVEVIVAVNTPAAQAAKKATKTVPVVIMRVADPVKSGLVASLARPGGNVTGLSFMPETLGPKGVELLHEILPKATHMAALYQGDNAGAVLIIDEVERKGGQIGLKFVRLPVHDESDYANAFEIASRGLSFTRFLTSGIEDCIPDGTTLWLFREKLAKAGVIEKLFDRFDQHLGAKGYIARGGQIVDATIVLRSSRL